MDSWALTGDRETILRAWRNRDPTPSLSTSITATDDPKSEPSAVSEQDLVVAPDHVRVDPMGSEQDENLIQPEVHSDVDMSEGPAVVTKTGKASSLIPAPSRMRRSTIVPGAANAKLSGLTDENIATRSKRLKR